MRWIYLPMLVVLAWTAGPAFGQEQGPELRRWGVGWDNGPGLRYKLGSAWGMGLYLDPFVIDRENESVDDPTRLEETQSNLGIGFLLFKDHQVVERLAIAPVMEASYYRWTQDYDAFDSAGRRYTSERSSSRVSLALGIRPSYLLWNRLGLETRFALRIVWEDRENRVTRQSQPTDVSKETRWTFDDLGMTLGSVRLFVYF